LHIAAHNAAFVFVEGLPYDYVYSLLIWGAVMAIMIMCRCKTTLK